MAQTASIIRLSEQLINQIKAGEVIERPANILKETIENSIDAKATQIDIMLRGNALEYISVSDNGIGMSKDDLLLAFEKHTTSKLNQFEDLYQLGTYGFRGEALGSIASISRIKCFTFQEKSPHGYSLTIDHSTFEIEEKLIKTDLDHGTKIIIQDIFYNTPARLKFIQSAQSEKNWIKKIIFSFILAHPSITFSFLWDEDEKLIYPGTNKGVKERLSQLIQGKDSLHQLQQIKKNYNQFEVEIYLLPKTTKTDYKFSYTFINKRFVIDKVLSRLIKDTLLRLSPQQDYMDLIFITLPSENLDVNVHPHKTTVKIFEQHQLWSLIHSCLNELLSTISNRIDHHKEYSPDNSFEIINEGETENQNDNLPSNLANFRLESAFTATISTHEIIYHWRESFLFKEKTSHQLFYFSIHKFQLFLKKHLLSVLHKHTPLFVSYPIDYKNEYEPVVTKLQNLGWEIDLVNNQQYLLRSVPTSFSHLPLSFLLETIGLIKINDIDQEHNMWKELLDIFPLEKLIEDKVITACVSPYEK